MREDGQRIVFNLGDLHGAGRILFFDGLEESNRWGVSLGIYGQTAARVGDRAYNGNWCLEFYGGASTPNGFVETYTERDFVLPASGQIVFRAVIGMSYAASYMPVGLYAVKYDNGIFYQFGFRVSPVNARPQIYGFAGTWGYCGADALILGAPGWHLFEFGVDLGSGEYKYAQCDGRVFNVDGVLFRKYGTVIVPRYQGVRIAQWMSGAGQRYLIDDVCIYI